MAGSVLNDAALLALLAEDLPYGDLTTNALALEQTHGRITFAARYDTCCSAVEEVARLLQLNGLSVTQHVASGTSVVAGTLLLEGEGDSRALLGVWKIAQNMLEWASGIASAAHQLVSAAKQVNPDVHVACTRKNTPGTKALSVKAVRDGGASIHRLGLSESLLLFPEHRQFSSASPQTLLQRCRSYSPELNRTVEVCSIDEALVWASAGAEIIQLEKFSPADIVRCRTQLAEQGLSPMLAAAGGVNPSNAAEYANSGATLLVTSWPYQARPKDIQVRFET